MGTLVKLKIELLQYIRKRLFVFLGRFYILRIINMDFCIATNNDLVVIR